MGHQRLPSKQQRWRYGHRPDMVHSEGSLRRPAGSGPAASTIAPAFCLLTGITAIILLFFGAASLSAQTGPFSAAVVVVHGDGSPGPYGIGRAFIGGSARADSTFSGMPITVSADDPAGRTVTFDRALAPDDSAAVTVAVPPQWLSDTYHRSPSPSGFRYTPPTGGSEGSGATPGQFPGLRFGGSKTFDVTVGGGNQVALNQTLRLNISGRITDDITLDATISDQSVPISPEGDTRELEELDRVLIQLRGPRFAVDMGDTELRRNSGRWLSYTRRLSGAEVRVGTDSLGVTAAAAASEGRYMSTTIQPVEGNQGPYRLIAADGNQLITVIPGTETVWINGVQLTRGADDDYTIDYTTGEITFTGRRIIGADMRIVCDYEYTSESYRRRFYAGGADGSLFGGDLTVAVTAAREADNASSPVLYDLDAAALAALAASGDSPATITGIAPAGDDSTGIYDLVDGHLVYVPAGQGQYKATFSWVGADKGSYRYLGGGVYGWVPPDQRVPGSGADYDPVRLLDGPVSHDLAGITLRYAPRPDVSIETELAASSLDRNTLSGIGDGDNGGGARRAGFSLAPKVTLGLPLTLSLTGDWRTQGATFTPLDRDRSAEANRDWGLPLLTVPGKETVSEYGAGASVAEGKFAGTGFRITGGRAVFGQTHADRTGGSLSFRLGARFDSGITVARISRTGLTGIPDQDIDRITAHMTGDARVLTPTLRYEHERAVGRGTAEQGTSYDDLTAGFRTSPWRGLTGDAEWNYRLEQAKHGAWSDSAQVRGVSVGLRAGDTASRSFRMQFAHRERTGSGASSTTDQAGIDWSYRPDEGIARFNWSYRAGRSREAAKHRNFLFVGPGRGTYRWEDMNGDGVRDPEEFIPDDHGEYYLFEETLADYRPVNVVSVFGSTGIDIPGGLVGLVFGRPVPLTLETTVDLTEKSAARGRDVFFLNLSKFRKSGLTTSGDSRVQTDLTAPLAGGGSGRFRFFRSDTYTAEYMSGAERQSDEEYSLRVRMPVSEAADVEMTLARGTKLRAFETRPGGDFNVVITSADAGISYYPRAAVTIGLAASGGFDRDRTRSIDATYYSFTPSAAYRFSGRGRVESSYTLTSVRTSGAAGSRIPYAMARGRRAGTNHDLSLSCDYRLSDRMSLIASYTGRQFGGREFEHFARMQVRALF